MRGVNTKQDKRSASQYAEEIILQGRLQGMGIRPVIFRLAVQCDLVGDVRNTAEGVEIHVEGSSYQIEVFKRKLLASFPDQAQVISEQYSDIPLTGKQSFEIVREADSDAIVTTVPLDTAVCRECLSEVHDSGNRRFRYAFNCCVRCGPRYTIIRQMPFERDDTAMADFPWCDECLVEYRSTDDRRFHAQTISCPTCGPRFWSVDVDGRRVDDQEKSLDLAADTLSNGLIVAIKGVGGYQLLVDATNADAVERLRQRKGRIGKPFAVMMRTPTEVELVADVNVDEHLALASEINPIVLLRTKGDSEIVTSVHPGLSTLGVMLPTTALHDLLLERVGRPLVCTSGNLEGEPIAFQVDEAETMLAGVCDLWLHHDRAIVRPIDDSVVRVISHKCVTLRLARGLAPLRLDLDSAETQMALGGQMKSSMAWSHGGSAFLGPHIGELGELASQERYMWHLADWQSLYRFDSSQAIRDGHPEYFTSSIASNHFASSKAIQHHYAHTLSVMLEHHLLDRTVLGVSWDGTGYGLDQTIWGGEFLIADKNQISRCACLRPFALPGGEMAIRQPWRIALSLLSQSDGLGSIDHLPLFTTLDTQVHIIRSILDNSAYSPVTSSGGRLFDGVAALILGYQYSEYEGQLPMMLEGIADPREKGSYEFAIGKDSLVELDWRPLLWQLCEDIRSEVSPEAMSMKFHRAVAKGIIAICREHSDLPVVLSGGVFQNRLLTELIGDLSEGHRQPIYAPGRIPPGDGGLAAGQLAAILSK